MGYFGTEGANDPGRAVGQGQRVPGGRLHRQQPGDHRVQITAEAPASPSRTSTRSRGTRRSPRSTGDRRGPQGSMIAGAIGDRLPVAGAHRRHRRPPARGRPGRHRARAEPRDRPRHPDVGLSMAEIATIAYSDPLAAARRACRPRDERPPPGAGADDLGQRDPRVHLRGRRRDRAVTLLRYIVSEDCGPMINPNVVEGQIDGGTVQGIGGALLEHLAYDDDGNPMSTTFVDYLMPTIADVPVIEHCHIETRVRGPAGTRASAKAAPSAPRLRWSTRSPTRSVALRGAHHARLPVTPPAVLALIDRRRGGRPDGAPGGVPGRSGRRRCSTPSAALRPPPEHQTATGGGAGEEPPRPRGVRDPPRPGQGLLHVQPPRPVGDDPPAPPAPHRHPAGGGAPAGRVRVG